jgi:dephospho-CoA kinase
MRIGITGGIGSGKSYICQILEKMGYDVFNSDREAKWLMENNAILIEKIKYLVGENAYIENNKINKKVLSQFIFNNKSNRLSINQIVHPFVYEYFEYLSEKFNSNQIVFYESALLFETGFYKNLDKNILVIAPYNTRLQRIQKRDQLSEKEIMNKINSQYSDDEKLTICDFVIDNNEYELLVPKIVEIINKLISSITS